MSAEETTKWRPSADLLLTTFAVMLTTFMVVLDSSIANVALPKIAGSFSSTQDESVWVLTSYLVANGVILPSTAWFSDIFGRKNFLIICTIVFTLASGACGLSVSMPMLIIARVIQGLGGGAILPIAQAILLESFPIEKRGLGMSIFGLGVILAPVIGPTLGGWITDTYSWNWIFLINLPIGIAATFFTYLVIKDPEYAKKKNKKLKIDYIGFILLTVWLFSLQYILDNGQKNDWFATLWVRNLLAVTIASFIIFIIRELKIKNPIVDLKIFLDRNFASGTALVAFMGGILYATLAILPLFMQHLLGYTATLSGLAISPRGFGSLFGLILCATLAGKVDDRHIISIGFAALAISCFMFGNLNLDIAISNVITPNVICGIAFSLVLVPLNTITFQFLKNSDMTNGSGIFSLSRSVGGAIGVSLVSTIISRHSQIHQNYLVEHLSTGNPVFNEQFMQLKSALAMSAGKAVADTQAGYLMYMKLIQQSTLLSFMDCFKLAGVLCLVLIPFVYLLKNKKTK